MARGCELIFSPIYLQKSYITRVVYLYCVTCFKRKATTNTFSGRYLRAFYTRPSAISSNRFQLSWFSHHFIGAQLARFLFNYRRLQYNLPDTIPTHTKIQLNIRMPHSYIPGKRLLVVRLILLLDFYLLLLLVCLLWFTPTIGNNHRLTA